MNEPAADLVAENARLRTRLERERRTRAEAELLAEQGTRQLYERQQQLELLNFIAESANAAITPEACMQVALDQWCRYTAWPVGHVYLTAEDAPLRLVPTALWHLDAPEPFADFRRLTEATPFMLGDGLPGMVLATGQSHWIEDAALSDNFPRGAAAACFAVHGAFGFPVRVGGEIVAVFEFFSPRVEARNDAWVALSAQVGALLGRVFERRRARREFERVQQQLIATSREAGMAEVATAVLHNVGNVLNSVNVSATLVLDRLQQSCATGLTKAAALLRDHRGDLAHYLTQDPRGRLLPAYVEAISDQLKAEHEALAKEAHGLQQNVEHIKHIVAMQQSYATVSGAKEIVALPELMEDALRLSAAALERHGIEIVRDYASVPSVLADRHKVLQILVNLVRNARQALESRATGRRLSLRIAAEDNAVHVEVADNGMGIAPENLARIFNHGFTTKKDGHGFGLHSGANAAREMGGSLTVRSDGAGAGATFSLVLPLNLAAARAA